MQRNPGRYREIEKRLQELEKWARQGLSDEEIIAKLGIGRSTFYRYKSGHRPFEEALKRGRNNADSEVERALYKKATGYVMTVRRPVKLKEIVYENGKKTRETERLEIAEEEQYFPPDTNSALFWLKNRCPDRWHDKAEPEERPADALDNMEPDEAVRAMRRVIAELPGELLKKQE